MAGGGVKGSGEERWRNRDMGRPVGVHREGLGYQAFSSRPPTSSRITTHRDFLLVFKAWPSLRSTCSSLPFASVIFTFLSSCISYVRSLFLWPAGDCLASCLRLPLIFTSSLILSLSSPAFFPTLSLFLPALLSFLCPVIICPTLHSTNQVP